MGVIAHYLVVFNSIGLFSATERLSRWAIGVIFGSIERFVAAK